MIENQWLNDDLRNVMRLQFHGRVDFIGTLMEGIIAVRSDGRIVGANRSALEQLGMSGATLRMQSLESLFDTSVGSLVDRFRSPLATPLAVRTAQGRHYHLHARFDWPVWSSLAEGAAQVLVLRWRRQHCAALAVQETVDVGPMPCRSPRQRCHRPARRSGGRTPVPCARTPHPERADRRHRSREGLVRSAPQRAAGHRRRGRAALQPAAIESVLFGGALAPMAPARCSSTRSAPRARPASSTAAPARWRADAAAASTRAAAATLRLVCASREPLRAPVRRRLREDPVSPQRSHAARTGAARAQRPDRTCAGHHRTRGAGHRHAAGRRRGGAAARASLARQSAPAPHRAAHRGGAGWQRSRDRARTLERRRRGGGTRGVRHEHGVGQ